MAAPSESGYRPLLPLSPPDAAWIKWLNGDLWEEHHDPNARSYCRDYLLERAGRTVTKEEWSRLASLIFAHGLPCVMSAGTFGFGLGIVVFDHAPVPHTPPECLITVTNKHLDDRGNAHDRHETAWQTFSRHTHTPDNERVCLFYGLERPRERGHYDY